MPSDSQPQGARKTLRIGHYDVVSHIATGGMGAVYKAVDIDLGREVAIKVLSPELAGKPGMLDRFRQEAQHAAKLRHENIVTIYEFGETNGMLYLAMELVDGIDLHEYISRKGQLDPEEARHLLIQAVKALDQMHKQGLVHRDIKPSNFLITKRAGKPLVKLTDLGLAREVDDSEFRLTRSGTTIGTVDYMSPEQARDSRAADIRSDIYSLGCTFYHMLAGKPPFPEGGLTERLYKHVEVEPPDIRQFNRKVPEALAAVLRRMLEKKQENRYQTPADLMKDLLQRGGNSTLDRREVIASLASLEDLSAADAQSGGARRPTSKTTIASQKSQTSIHKRYRDGKLLVGEGPTQPWWPWVAAVGAVLLVALVTVAIALWFNNPLPEVLETASAIVTEPHQPAPEVTPPPETNPSLRPRHSGEDLPEPVRSEKPAPDPVEQPAPKPSPRSQPEVKPPPPPRRTTETPAQPESAPHRPATDQVPMDPTRPRPMPPVASPRVPTVRPQPVPGKTNQPNVETTKAASNTGISEPTVGPLAKLVPTTPDKQVPDPPQKTNWLAQSRYPRLYQPSAPIDADKLREEMEAPWAGAAKPGADIPTYRVSRLGRGEKLHFDSLWAALAALPAGAKDVVIEIHDNGPLFEVPVAMAGHDVTLRAGKGYRPLIAWDVAHSAGANSNSFLSVKGGNLTLQGMDIVVRCPTAWADDLNLLQVTGGDVLIEHCTLSLAGRSRATVRVLQLDGTRADKNQTRCRLTRCYVRGPDVVALDIRTPGARVLLDGCLVVGGNLPLLKVIGRDNLPATMLWMARSTLVASQNLLHVDAATASDNNPAVHWSGWDTLLARSHSQDGGDLVHMADGDGTEGLQWRAVNCLYAGWRSLLASGSHRLSAADLPVWQRFWQRSEGDGVLFSSWPVQPHPDPSEIPPVAYRTLNTSACFAATSGPQPLGCDLDALPPVRDGWIGLTYDRVVLAPFDLPVGGPPPEIPVAESGRYAGGTIDLNQVDLGQHLEGLHRAKQLEARVVLHLTGSGDSKTSPIRLTGIQLVLHFQPTPGSTQPLTLVPNGSTAAARAALIDIEDGSLDIIGGSIRFPDFKNAPVPPHVIKVQGGDLRLFGCRLEGPLGRVPDVYRGLIRFTGSGDASPDKVHRCAIVDSTLVTGKTCLQSVGAGMRLRLHNSVLVAGGDALALDPGEGSAPRLNGHCTLEHNTVAARRAVLHLADTPRWTALREPFVVQARANLFLDPFAGTSHQADLLAADGEALAHGLLLWQGDGNGFDRRLQPLPGPANGGAAKPQSFSSTWTRLWGSLGEREPSFLDPQARTFEIDWPQLGLLALPTSPRIKMDQAALGADLVQLGIVKKPIRKLK